MAKPETLRKVLKNSNISQEIIDKYFEDVTDKSSRKKKAKYLFHAVNIMDAELDESTRQEIMESCACTIGSSVDKKTEQFAKKTQNLSWEAVLLCE